MLKAGVNKKTEKPIKPRKPEKKQPKKPNRKKTRLNRLNFLKNRPVRFGFITKKLKKPNRTETDKKPEKNRAKPENPSQNRFEPVFSLKKANRTETGRFDPISVFFSKQKKFNLITFFDKNRTEPKMISPTFGGESNAPRCNSGPKTQQRNDFQGVIVLSTVKTVYVYSIAHNAMCLCPFPYILKEPSRE